MELIIQILMLFMVLNCLLKLSFWKLWQTVLFGIVCGIFVIAIYPQAILQSKTQIADLLLNTSVMQNMAVIVTIDSVICFAFCFTAIKKLFGEKTVKWAGCLHAYISPLIFPVFFYLLTQLIFTLSGTSFATISWGFAVALTVLIPSVTYLIKQLLPEKDIKLEMHFLISLFISILGLICTVNGNVSYAATEQPTDFKAIIVSIGLFAVAFFIGFLMNKTKWYRIQKKNYKKQIKQTNMS